MAKKPAFVLMPGLTIDKEQFMSLAMTEWRPISEFSEEATKDRWVCFTDGEAIATRLIFPPMIFGFGLSIEPTYFAVMQLPTNKPSIEQPTVDATFHEVKEITSR